MAKRLHDTEIWHKEWYCNLSQTHKLLVQYLFDNCDCAGVFEANYKIMQFLIGADARATPERPFCGNWGGSYCWGELDQKNFTEASSGFGYAGQSM